MKIKGIALSINTMISIVLIIIVLAVGLSFQHKIASALLGMLNKFGLKEEFKLDIEVLDSIAALNCALI